MLVLKTSGTRKQKKDGEARKAFDEMRQREERRVVRTEVVAEVEGEIFGPGSVVGRGGAGCGVEEPPGRPPDGVVGVGGFCSSGCHDEDEEP